MYKSIALIIVLAATNARAQYYYNDILGNLQAKENFQLLKKNNVKRVTVFSTDPDGAPTEGFAILQEINASKNQMVTNTTSSVSQTSILQSTFGANGYPAITRDSTEASVSSTQYTYDAGFNSLKTVTSTTYEPGRSDIKFFEERLYQFNDAQPLRMTRIKNRKDSLRVEFVKEEHGWIGEERWIQKNKVIETYYYYYDPAGRLSDIGRFNTAARKILPDYTFEYDEAGKLTGMSAFINGTNQYRTWRYTYDARGLRMREIIFSNLSKQAEGKITYNYQ